MKCSGQLWELDAPFRARRHGDRHEGYSLCPCLSRNLGRYKSSRAQYRLHPRGRRRHPMILQRQRLAVSAQCLQLFYCVFILPRFLRIRKRGSRRWKESLVRHRIVIGKQVWRLVFASGSMDNREVEVKKAKYPMH